MLYLWHLELMEIKIKCKNRLHKILGYMVCDVTIDY